MKQSTYLLITVEPHRRLFTYFLSFYFMLVFLSHLNLSVFLSEYFFAFRLAQWELYQN